MIQFAPWKSAAAALALACLAAVSPPRGDVAAYAEDVDTILREAVARGRAYERLVDLCTTAPHRLSGSAGAAAAVEWARQEMIDIGLENVRLEPVTVPHWERGDVCLVRVAEPAGLVGDELTSITLGSSVATPEFGLTAEVIEVQSFEELAERRAEADGKIVFFNRPMDPESINTFAAYGGAVGQRSRGASEAAKAGAVAALIRSMSTRLDDVPHTGNMSYAVGVPKIPTAALSTVASERLSDMIEAGVPVKLHFRQNPVWHADKPSANVVGEIVGTTFPEEILVVGGHLDGWDVGQGAHDDGAGTCEAFEAARLLLQLGLRPKRTIRVVAFMNEENGLAGGRAYREQHAAEMPNHVFALESDSGGFRPRGFTTTAKGDAKAILDEIAKLLEPADCGLMLDGRGGADIGPMQLDGVLLAGLRPDSSRYFDVHHSESDTLATVNDREVNLAAGAMAALLYVIADLDERLPRR